MAGQALLKAVMAGRLTQTRLLLQLPDVDVNGKDLMGRTPLICALFTEDAKLRNSFLRVLLKAGALVSLSDHKKKNALMWACAVANREDVSLLLRNADDGLHVNTQNLQGQTALWIAVDSGKIEVVQEILKALVQKNMDIEVADILGVTPIMHAATLRHLECLRILVRHLDSTAISRKKFLSSAKIHKIFKVLGLEGYVKMAPVSPRRTSCSESVGKDPKSRVPAIRIISSDDAFEETPIVTEDHGKPRNENEEFSIEFIREQTRCSTPLLPRRSVGSRCSSPQQSDHASTIAFTDELGFSPSPRPSTRSGIVTPDSHRHHHADRSDLDDTEKVWKISRVYPNMSRRLDGRFLDSVHLTQIGGLRTERLHSVRDSLPMIFDIFAEQTSISFRKTAVIPTPPEKKQDEALLKQGRKQAKGKGKPAFVSNQQRAKRKYTVKL